MAETQDQNPRGHDNVTPEDIKLASGGDVRGKLSADAKFRRKVTNELDSIQREMNTLLQRVKNLKSEITSQVG